MRAKIRFNLLKEGTGIRYNARPKGGLRIDPSRKPLIAAFLASSALLLYMASTNMESLVKWDLFQGEVLVEEEVIPEELFEPEPVEPPPVRKRIVLNDAGEVLPGRELPKVKKLVETKKIVMASLPKKEPLPVKRLSVSEPPPLKTVKEEYRLRFALFLYSDNAEKLKKMLGGKGVRASVRRSMRAMPVHRVKIGPFSGRENRKMVMAALRKIGVATLPFIEQEYVVTGRIWIKDKVLKVQMEMNRMAIDYEVESGRQKRAVYTVSSEPFYDRTLAVSRLEELKILNIEARLEKKGS